MYGGIGKFQQDDAWSDLILFHEYFPMATLVLASALVTRPDGQPWSPS